MDRHRVRLRDDEGVVAIRDCDYLLDFNEKFDKLANGGECLARAYKKKKDLEGNLKDTFI